MMKKMKEIFSVLLVVILTFNLCSVATFAVGEDIVVSIESVSAKRGDTVDVPIALTKNSGFVTLGIAVGYDSSVLEMVCPEHEDGGFCCYPAIQKKTDFGETYGVNWGANSRYHTVNPYQMQWVYAEGKDIVYTGEIAKITFRVKEDAPIGTTDLEVTVTESNKADRTKNLFSTVNGTVTVECANHVKDSGTVTKQPTCTAPGETVYKCSVCGAVMATEKAPAATGHIWGKWEQTKVPTCTEEGEETRVCQNDPAHVQSRKVYAFGHKFGDWELTKAPTCTEEGEETCVCQNDPAHVQTRDVAPLGHYVDIEWTVTKEPTLTEEGKREGTCSRCGEFIEEDMPKLTASIVTEEGSDLEATITTDEADPFNGYTAAAIIENEEVSTDPIDGKDVIGGYGLAIADLDAFEFIDGEKVVTVKMKLTADMLAKYENFGIALNGKVVESTVADGYITFTGKISDMEKIAVLNIKIAAVSGGACGNNLTWLLDKESGVLTISGSGRMDNYNWDNLAPWYSQHEAIQYVNIKDGVTTIGSWAFNGCSKLTSITIPDSVTETGDGIFYGCTNLTSIMIPDGITAISGWSFHGCSKLMSITIPDSVMEIGDRAFSYCSNLMSLTIPDGVATIDYGAFSYCSKLTSITIPDSVTTIGDGAFSYCSNLTINCYEGSAAQDYAVSHDIPYVLLSKEDETLIGDANDDGKINLDDVVVLAQYVAEWDIECNEAALDVNGDGIVNLDDIVHLAQYVAEWEGIVLG